MTPNVEGHRCLIPIAIGAIARSLETWASRTPGYKPPHKIPRVGEIEARLEKHLALPGALAAMQDPGADAGHAIAHLAYAVQVLEQAGQPLPDIVPAPLLNLVRSINARRTKGAPS